MREYDIKPSPIRTDYIKSDALNPVSRLRYGKLVASSKLNNSASFSNTTTFRSLFDLCATSNIFLYGGVRFNEDPIGDVHLVFPSRFFSPGENVRFSAAGQIQFDTSTDSCRLSIGGLDVRGANIGTASIGLTPTTSSDSFYDWRMDVIETIGYGISNAFSEIAVNQTTILSPVTTTIARVQSVNSIATGTGFSLATDETEFRAGARWETAADPQNVFTIYNLNIEVI